MSRIMTDAHDRFEKASQSGGSGFEPRWAYSEMPAEPQVTCVKVKRRGSRDKSEVRQRRIVNRTAQLPATSRALYRIEHYSSVPAVALSAIAIVFGLVVVGAILRFPSAWVTAFEVSVSGVTLVMVFAIQHTQGREQAATQRKLDELLRALPGADDSLMMLEEAPKEVMLGVEEEQRDTRAESTDTDTA